MQRLCALKETLKTKHLFLKTKYNCCEQKNNVISIDNKLAFKYIVKNLCKKDLQKVWALARLSRYLNNTQKSLILKSVVRSQFSHCPIVLMLCSRY